MIEFVIAEGIEDMEISRETFGSVTVIALDGKLNSASSQQFQDEVLDTAKDCAFILIDMTQVTYLSSAGLRMLLLLYRYIRENNGYLALTGLTDEVRDIMDITGFLDLFTIYDDRTQALKALRKTG